jgi:hypothetical protein
MLLAGDLFQSEHSRRLIFSTNRLMSPASWLAGALPKTDARGQSVQKMMDFIETDYARDNQVNCDDIVQKSGNDEDQHASQK